MKRRELFGIKQGDDLRHIDTSTVLTAGSVSRHATKVCAAASVRASLA